MVKSCESLNSTGYIDKTKQLQELSKNITLAGGGDIGAQDTQTYRTREKSFQSGQLMEEMRAIGLVSTTAPTSNVLQFFGGTDKNDDEQ